MKNKLTEKAIGAVKLIGTILLTCMCLLLMAVIGLLVLI